MEKHCILVADDDDGIRESVAEVLESEGYSVVTAGDGAAALFAATHADPELILLDLRMPLLDGPAFMRELQGRGVDVPIVVMTAAEDDQYVESEFHPAGFVGKPFDLEELLAAVDRAHPARAA